MPVSEPSPQNPNTYSYSFDTVDLGCGMAISFGLSIRYGRSGCAVWRENDTLSPLGAWYRSIAARCRWSSGLTPIMSVGDSCSPLREVGCRVAKRAPLQDVAALAHLPHYQGCVLLCKAKHSDPDVLILRHLFVGNGRSAARSEAPG
eukprot:365471-Chlamydomonas_euryale.AAC.26